MLAEQAAGLNVPNSSQIAQVAQSFYLDREAAGCTAATLHWYRRYVDALVTWLTAHDVTDLAEVQPDHLRTYLVELQARGLADRTRHHYASAARAFFNYAVAEGLLPVSPMQRVKMPRLPKELLDALNVADVQALLDVCDDSVDPVRDKAIVLCLLDTGCRTREFLALNVGDWDSKTGAVHIRLGKGKKERVAFLGLKAHRVLLCYLLTRKQVQHTRCQNAVVCYIHIPCVHFMAIWPAPA
jgi:site-specific recombinase XerD